MRLRLGSAGPPCGQVMNANELNGDSKTHISARRPLRGSWLFLTRSWDHGFTSSLLRWLSLRLSSLLLHQSRSLESSMDCGYLQTTVHSLARSVAQELGTAILGLEANTMRKAFGTLTDNTEAPIRSSAPIINTRGLHPLLLTRMVTRLGISR